MSAKPDSIEQDNTLENQPTASYLHCTLWTYSKSCQSSFKVLLATLECSVSVLYNFSIFAFSRMHRCHIAVPL